MLKSFYHTGFVVRDLDKSVDFYTNVLGMRVTRRLEGEGEAGALTREQMEEIARETATAAVAEAIEGGIVETVKAAVGEALPGMIERVVADAVAAEVAKAAKS